MLQHPLTPCNNIPCVRSVSDKIPEIGHHMTVTIRHLVTFGTAYSAQARSSFLHHRWRRLVAVLVGAAPALSPGPEEQRSAALPLPSPAPRTFLVGRQVPGCITGGCSGSLVAITGAGPGTSWPSARYWPGNHAHREPSPTQRHRLHRRAVPRQRQPQRHRQRPDPHRWRQRRPHGYIHG